MDFYSLSWLFLASTIKKVWKIESFLVVLSKWWIWCITHLGGLLVVTLWKSWRLIFSMLILCEFLHFFFKWIFWSLIEVVGFINLFVLLAFRLFVYVFVCDCIVFWLWFVLVCFVIMWSWWCCSYNIMQLKLESLWWLWILYVFGGRNVRIGMTLVVFKCHLFLMGIGHSVDYGFFVNFCKILVLLFVVNAISWILMNLHVSVRCINKFFVWIVWRWLCCRDLLVVDIRHVSKLRWVVRLDRLGTL